MDVTQVTLPGAPSVPVAQVMPVPQAGWKFEEEQLSPEEVNRRLSEYARIRKISEAMDVEAAKVAATKKIEKKIYKSVIPSCNFIFPSGKAAIFKNGLFSTDREPEIAVLDAEIAAGHPHIRHFNPEIDVPQELTGFDKNNIDQLREYFFREFAAQQLANMAGRDMGTSNPAPLNPATSANVNDAMIDGGLKLPANLTNMLAAMKTGNNPVGVLKADVVPVITDQPQGDSNVPKLTELLAQQGTQG